jgi:hypothetical protein
MPDTGLVVLLATPLTCGVVLWLLLRRALAGATPVRGLAVAPVVVVASFAATRLQGDQVASGVMPDAVVNRLLAGVVLLGAAVFVVLNRDQGSGVVRWGIRSTAAGAASNALAMLVFGSMPLLVSAVRAQGAYLAPGDHPDPRYVAVDGSHPLALVLGDVLPVPPLDVVVSLGDLLLAAGCAILLSYFLSQLLGRGPLPLAQAHPKHTNGAGAASGVTGDTVAARADAGATPAASASCTRTSAS